MSQVEVKKRQIETFAYMVECISLLIFGQMIGNMGIAYLAISMECVTFAGILLGANAAPIIGRILRAKNAKGQYKNAARIRSVLLLLQFVLGVLGTVALVLGAKPLAEKLLGVPNATFLIMILAPTLLIKMLTVVLLGAFQGVGSEFASVAYAILRQVGILILGAVLCKTFMAYGEKVSDLLGQEVFTYVYGGIGIALAMLITELLLFLGILVVSRLKLRPKKERNEEGMRAVDSMGTILMNYMGSRKLHLLMYLLIWLPVICGVILYGKNADTAQVMASNYGQYIGMYLLPCALAILCISLLVIPIYGRIASMMRKDEIRLARNAFSAGVHIVIVNGLFATVFIACMAERIVNLLAGTVLASAANMLKVGSVLVLLSVFAIFFFGLLRAWGKELQVIIALGIGNVLYLIVTAVFLNAGSGMGVMALVYGGLFAMAAICFYMGGIVFRHMRTGVDMATQIAIPAAAACVVGLLCIFLGKALAPHVGSLVTILVCFAIALVVYWAILLLLRSFREQEIKYIPGGAIIQAVGRALHVF